MKFLILILASIPVISGRSLSVESHFDESYDDHFPWAGSLAWRYDKLLKAIELSLMSQKMTSKERSILDDALKKIQSVDPLNYENKAVDLARDWIRQFASLSIAECYFMSKRSECLALNPHPVMSFKSTKEWMTNIIDRYDDIKTRVRACKGLPRMLMVKIPETLNPGVVFMEIEKVTLEVAEMLQSIPWYWDDYPFKGYKSHCKIEGKVFDCITFEHDY